MFTVRAAGATLVLVLVLPYSRFWARVPGTEEEEGRIAFASHEDGNWEIYVAEAGGNGRTRLTNRPMQDRFPVWSPGGGQIAFGSQTATGWDLWVTDADGRNSRKVASDVVPKSTRPWTPDGARILFASRVEGDVEINSVELSTGRVTRLTRSRGEDRDPTVSPDARHAAFSSDRAGRSQLYVMEIDGSGVRPLTAVRHQVQAPAGLRMGSILLLSQTGTEAGTSIS